MIWLLVFIAITLIDKNFGLKRLRRLLFFEYKQNASSNPGVTTSLDIKPWIACKWNWKYFKLKADSY